MRADGWDPARITDRPGDVYPPHQRAETKLLVFLASRMAVAADGALFDRGAGDRLEMTGGVAHAAQGGKAPYSSSGASSSGSWGRCCTCSTG